MFINADDDQVVAGLSVRIYTGSSSFVLTSDTKGRISGISDSAIDSIEIVNNGYYPSKFDSAGLKINANTVYLHRLRNSESVILRQNILGFIPTDKSVHPADARLQNPQTTSDLVGLNGNCFIQKSQMGGGSPMMKGFGGNAILIMVDGVRMNHSAFAGDYNQNLITIDPLMITDADIIDGAASTQFGPGALGGVISIRTKNPEITDSAHYRGNAMLRSSTANKENSWHADLEYGRNKVAGISSISIFNFSDLKMGTSGPDFYTKPIYSEFNGQHDSIIQNDDPNVQYFTGYSQINFNQKFRYKPNKQNDLIAHIGFTTSSQIPVYSELVKQRSGQFIYGDYNYGPQKWLQSDVHFTRVLTSGFADTLQIIAAYQTFEQSTLRRALFTSDLYSYTDNIRAINLNIDAVKHFPKNLFKGILHYGIEALSNSVRSEGKLTHINTDSSFKIMSELPVENHWYSVSGYTSFTAEVTTKMVFQLSARVGTSGLTSDYFNPYYQHTFNSYKNQTGYLSLNYIFNYKLNRNNFLYFKATDAYRPPDVSDLGKLYQPLNSGIAVRNQNLKPEANETVEYGYYRTHKKISFRISTWLSNYSDRIQVGDYKIGDEDSVIFNGTKYKTISLVNQDRFKIYGVDFSFNALINKRWDASGAFHYVNSVKSNQEPLQHMAPGFGNIALTYRYLRFKAQFYSNFQLQQSHDRMSDEEIVRSYLYLKDAKGLSYSPSWSTLNLKVVFFVSNSLNINLGLENITNQRYRPYAWGMSAPGRNLILSIYGRF